jgi:hypothetical protein
MLVQDADLERAHAAEFNSRVGHCQKSLIDGWHVLSGYRSGQRRRHSLEAGFDLLLKRGRGGTQGWFFGGTGAKNQQDY